LSPQSLCGDRARHSRRGCAATCAARAIGNDRKRPRSEPLNEHAVLTSPTAFNLVRNGQHELSAILLRLAVLFGPLRFAVLLR
jgi:hypothetical protein